MELINAMVDALAKLGITGVTSVFVLTTAYLLHHILSGTKADTQAKIDLALALQKLADKIGELGK